MLEALPDAALPSTLSRTWDWQLGMHSACASPVAGERPWVQCLAQGHFNIGTGGGGDRAIFPVTSRQHALPPEPAFILAF